MKPRIISSLLLGGVFGLLVAGNAGAVVRGTTTEGLSFANGGVTVGELRDLAAERQHYDLWVTTAAKGSGAFLSDVQVKITDAKKNVVLETVMEGPWLLVDLAPGKYTIEAMFDGKSQKHITSIAQGGHHQAVLYFDSPAEVSPDWKSPFAQSPYASNTE
jgi:hypothetical protein